MRVLVIEDNDRLAKLVADGLQRRGDGDGQAVHEAGPDQAEARDGIARPLEDSVGKVKADAPIERRKGRSAPKRRARFLARRREGDLGLRLVVMGEEIIARN